MGKENVAKMRWKEQKRKKKNSYSMNCFQRAKSCSRTYEWIEWKEDREKEKKEMRKLCQ